MSGTPPPEKGERERLSFSVQGDLIGLPGQPVRFVVRRTRTASQTAFSENPAERKTFKVIFTFSRPGQAIATDQTMPSADFLEGNSHLRLRSSADASTKNGPEISFPVLTDDGFFRIRETVNDEGFINKLEILSIEACDFWDAERIAKKLLVRSLRWYATHLDIPLTIYQLDVTDLHTDDLMIYRASKPYDAAVIPDGIRVFDIQEEPAAYASIYSEALNSNSHIYQFLCFFKIIDGLLIRRARSAVEAVARGEKPSRSPEKLPADLEGLVALLTSLFPVEFHWDQVWASSVFPSQFWGKKITHIADTKLRPLRNDLAHAFLDSDSSGIPVSMDEGTEFSDVVNLLPMTKCFARWMLRNEFPDQFPS